jgi:hypothetical protein
MCVNDAVLSRSPAEHVRRPNLPTESPTLGLTHLQFEAMLTTARASTNANDFALVRSRVIVAPAMFSLQTARTETGRACASTLTPVDPTAVMFSHPLSAAVDAHARSAAAATLARRPHPPGLGLNSTATTSHKTSRRGLFVIEIQRPLLPLCARSCR